jgi:phosphatidylglycerol---prolipoprotein diacylglyceryl transferase
MYPRLSDMINDLLGTSIRLPVQTYGFFVAMAFVVGAVILSYELKRKEKDGLLKPQKKTIIKGKPASISNLAVSAILGFLLGFKGLAMVLNYSEFVENPQEFLLSAQGSILGGLVLAGLSVYSTWHSYNKEKLAKPKSEEIEVRPHELTATFIMIAAAAGIAGAKLFDILENFSSFLADPLGTLFSFQGLTFYGGLIVAALTLIWYAHKNNIPWKVLADAAAPALLLAYAVGRLGCQFSGDGCWGIENLNPKPEWLAFLPDWAWAYDFPNNVIREGIPIHNCSGQYCRVLENPVYPTSLYESMLSLFFFGVVWLIRKKIVVSGMLFSIYLIMNGTARFLVEKIRVNPPYEFLGMELTQAEIISFTLILLGIAGIIYLLVVHKRSSGNKLANNL